MVCTIGHPEYPFVLGSNRDEFFERPTQRAGFVDDDVLMPVDLARREHGTWIGVNRNGRICVLVNYREGGSPCQLGAVSRGKITRAFLESDLEPLAWARQIRAETDNFANVGGFTLFFGVLRRGAALRDSLYLLSNRLDGVVRPFETAEVFGLSNSPISRPWAKVVHGERLMAELLERERTPLAEKRLGVVDSVFQLMSSRSDRLAGAVGLQQAFSMGGTEDSIFVPRMPNDLPAEADQALGAHYGTRTQTVIVMSRDGVLSYFEKDMADGIKREFHFPIV